MADKTPPKDTEKEAVTSTVMPAPAPVSAPAPTAAKKAATVDVDEAPDIPVADLIARGGQFLGHPPFVVAGALAGRDPSDELSISDAQALVEEWLGMEIASADTPDSSEED